MDSGRSHKYVGIPEDPFKIFCFSVEHFQRLFGLDNWKIETRLIKSELKSDSHNIETFADPRYYRATITIYKEVLEKRDDWDMFIIHEMIHIVMSLYDFYTDNMGIEGSKELFYIARENSVSQLAHIIDRIIKDK